MKRPTNVPQSNPLKKNQASWWTGWTKPIHDIIHTLEADIAGLQSRLRNPIHKGRPAAYVGFRDFIPERSIVRFPEEGISPLNYVVRDGQDYDIPVIMPGPGVFVAEELTVTVFQQKYAPTKWRFDGPPGNFVNMQVQMRPNAFVFPSEQTPYYSTKYSLYPTQTSFSYLGDEGDNALKVVTESQRTINYFWNLIDTKSQRRLADAYISQMVLTPPSLPERQAVDSSSFSFTDYAFERLPDGDLFRFCTPWVFERDGQVNFSFRPITPVFQFDSALSGTDPAVGLPYDDRVNGVRDQRVRVQVEIHGYRFETDQDAIRAGVLVR